jgi:hypothetical protein
METIQRGWPRIIVWRPAALWNSLRRHVSSIPPQAVATHPLTPFNWIFAVRNVASGAVGREYAEARTSLAICQSLVKEHIYQIQEKSLIGSDFQFTPRVKSVR